MDADSFGKLAFPSLSYEEGIDEINAFYPPDGSPERESDNAARLAAIDLDSARTKAIDGRETTSSEDNEQMEDVEHSHHFTTSAEPASHSTRPIEHDNPAFNPFNKVTPPRTLAEADLSQLAETRTVLPPALPMEHSMRGDCAAALSGSPVPPSSSNRGDLQAEMRHEEEDQPPRISNLAPLPFSLSNRGQKFVAGKRGASVSPLAAKRPARKKAKSGKEESLPSSPPVFMGSPSKTAATHQGVPSDLAQGILSPQALTESEQDLQPDTLPPVDRSTQHASDVQNLASETHQKDAEFSRAKSQQENNTKRNNVNGAAAAPPKHRRPMGSNELRDLIGTDVSKGVHAASSSSQRMTRHQKQEREASQPGASAKEAVKKRRQSGVKGAK